MGKKFLARVYPSVRPSVGGFFICNKISDGKGSYRRLLYRWTCSVGEAVGNYSPTELIPGTDKISPSVKLFNGVVISNIERYNWKKKFNKKR